MIWLCCNKKNAKLQHGCLYSFQIQVITRISVKAVDSCRLKPAQQMFVCARAVITDSTWWRCGCLLRRYSPVALLSLCLVSDKKKKSHPQLWRQTENERKREKSDFFESVLLKNVFMLTQDASTFFILQSAVFFVTTTHLSFYIFE